MNGKLISISPRISLHKQRAGWVLFGTESSMCVCIVCVMEEETRAGGALDVFPQTPSTSFLLQTRTVRTTSPPSRDSIPESQSHSEPCKPVWAVFSLPSNFGSPRPASMCATLSWLKFLNLSEKPHPKFPGSPVFCSACSDVLFPGSPCVCSGWAPAC